MDFAAALPLDVSPVLEPEFCPVASVERPAAVLGLPPDESDPVRIILTAHLRLRNCRRRQKAAGRPLTVSEMTSIIRARDALLQRSVRRFASRVANMGISAARLNGPPR
jgi:hypothetical protein